MSGKISFRADGRHIQEGREPSAQLACIHMLADILLEASGILALPPRPAWMDIKRRLPPHTLIGTGNDARIALWEGQDLEICHRHHSHLNLPSSLGYTGGTGRDRQPDRRQYYRSLGGERYGPME